MTNRQFIKLTAAKTTSGTYEVIINHHFVNFAVPSNSGQVGKSIVTLAREGERRNTVAAMCDLDTLALKISHLTPVKVFDTGRGEFASAGLVNLSRVVQITEYEKFSNLTFIDGEQINVMDTLV